MRFILRVTYRKHLISLIKNEHLHSIGLQEATLDHILNSAGSSDDNLRTILKSLHVVTHTGTANAGMALDVHEVTNGHNDLLDLLSQLTSRSKDQSLALLHTLVDLLKDGNREGGRLASTRLGLGNDIVACADMSMNISNE